MLVHCPQGPCPCIHWFGAADAVQQWLFDLSAHQIEVGLVTDTYLSSTISCQAYSWKLLCSALCVALLLLTFLEAEVSVLQWSIAVL